MIFLFHSKAIETEKLMAALTETPQTAPIEQSSNEGDEEEEAESMGVRAGKVNLTLQTSNLPQLLSPQVVVRLHSIAGRLLSGGYGSQCIACYRCVCCSSLYPLVVSYPYALVAFAYDISFCIDFVGLT